MVHECEENAVGFLDRCWGDWKGDSTKLSLFCLCIEAPSKDLVTRAPEPFTWKTSLIRTRSQWLFIWLRGMSCTSWPSSDIFEQFPWHKGWRYCLKLFSDVTTVSSLAGSDTERSLSPVTDPSNPLSNQLPSTSTANSPMDSDSMPTVALSLCGGLKGNTQISHGRWEERGNLQP